MQLTPRQLLKLQLSRERSTYVPGKASAPICPICDRPIFDDEGDLHECIVTRGMVAGTSKEKRNTIYSRYNCVLRHNTCPDGQSHKPGIGSETDFEECLRQIVEYEGYDKIIEWLDRLAEIYPIVASQAKQRVVSTFISIGNEGD